MKRRTQKLFIAIFAFLIAWFAITSAYVFDVTNWNPFWTLNLSKLIIKNLSQTWIILDSEDYTIKIDPDHNDPDGWQIRVYQICDENGQNCRAIANLYTWTQGVPWPQWNTWADGVWIQDISSEKVWKTTTVTVTYTNWETINFDILDWNDGTGVNWWWMAFTNNSQNNYICRKSWDAVTCNGLKLSSYPQNNRLCYVKDNVLYCDQVNLFEELSGRINDVSENINNWALIIYKWWTSYTFTANQSEDKTIQLWPIWWSNWNVCVKSWDDISCNTSVKLWAMSWQKRCYYDGTKINCNQNAPEPWAGGWATWLYLTPAWTNNNICIKQSDNTIYCNIAQDYYATADRLASEVAAIMSLINARTDNDTWVANAQLKSGYVAAPQKTTANKVWKTDDSGNPAWRDDANTWQANTVLQNGYVAGPTADQKWKCWKTDPVTGIPSWWNCWWGWDWITLITWQNNMYCKYIESNDGKWGTTKWIQCTYDAWSSTSPSWWGDSLWETGTAVPNGAFSLTIWNHIRPFNDDYNLYFSDNTTIYHGWTLKFWKAWFNLASSPVQFDAKGARFWYMNDSAFSGAWVGINGWMLVIGNNSNSAYNKIMIFASGTTSTNESNYEILSNKALLVWSYNHWYIYFHNNQNKVWINTTDVTNAALTVNGWLKIWYGCISKTCSSGNVGTIVYYETKDAYNNNLGHYAWCKSYWTQNNRQTYAWVELDFGNWSIISWTTLPTPTCNSIMPISSDMYQGEMAMQWLTQH